MHSSANKNKFKLTSGVWDGRVVQKQKIRVRHTVDTEQEQINSEFESADF